MILRALRKLNRDQRGFTLIELLVVITILGVLAAIVSISLLGITSKAQETAKQAELHTVQAAFDAMLSDQRVPGSSDGSPSSTISPACTGVNGGATKDMKHFPRGGQSYLGPDTGSVTVLSTHYLREANTRYSYVCDGFGNVNFGPSP